MTNIEIPVPYPVSGQSVEIEVTLAVTTTAYEPGDVMGGLITFPNALRSPTLSGLINSIQCVESGTRQIDTRVLWLFDSQPTSSTFTDNSAPNIATVDVPKILGRFPLGAPNSDLGTMTNWQVDGIGKVVQSIAATLWGVLITQGGPTPSSASAISVTVGLVQD